MLRFDTLEALGVRMAALSDRSDGDCGRRAQDPAWRNSFLLKCGVDTARLFAPAQVHGTHIEIVGGRDTCDGGSHIDTQCRIEGDGVMTARRGFPIGITVADCVPVLLFDPVRHAGGVVHAGRVGTSDGIAGIAVAALRDRLGVDPANLRAVIGPSAGPCCYEVSQVLAEAFRNLGLPARGRYLDLWEANRRQLEGAGVPARQVEVAGLCTICGDRFFSYRRGDRTERNLAVLML